MRDSTRKPVSFAPGARVGPYDVVSMLGAGGMGEVYRARDSRLARDVAIKVVAFDVSDDPDRLRRFEQEARTVAAISHPNILSIYDVGTTAGAPYVVFELLEGESLRDRMAREPVPARKAVGWAAQIARGLAAAHERGIVHRDVKPENVFVTKDGMVKILDFGLAKLVHGEETVEAAGHSSTLTSPGTILGTVGYMSPEQVRGQVVDARSDIFSLGAVLYEMLSGQRAFGRETAADTLTAILKEDPAELASVHDPLRQPIEQIVRRCLEKTPEERFQSARDLAFDLEALSAHLGHAATSQKIVQTRRGLPKVAIAAGSLAIAVIVAYSLTARGGAIDSIAILPFVNASANPEMEYLSDGITESLINSLSQLTRLKVIARTTAFRYKGRQADPVTIGRELGVRAVLTGQVVERGEALIIQADLVDVEGGSQLWGEQYSSKRGDVLEVQQEISRELSERLRVRLSGEELKQLAKRHTASTDAYRLYLHGRYYLSNFERLEEATKAVGFFERAIAADPEFALAYAGKARAFLLLGEPFNVGLPPKEALREAKAAATKALQIDDTLGEAHASLAHVMKLHDWDWKGAETEYRRAIELDPNNAFARRDYAIYLQNVGRHSEALAQIRRSAELDPLNDLNRQTIGFVHYTAREYDEAIDQFQAVGSPLGLAWAYQQKKMHREAIAVLQKAIRGTEPDDLAVASVGCLYAESGKADEARKRLDELTERSKRRYVSPYLMAYPHVGLGDREQALAWLEKGYQSRDQWMIWLKVDPVLDSLRSDPRFADLLRRVGLAP